MWIFNVEEICAATRVTGDLVIVRGNSRGCVAPIASLLRWGFALDEVFQVLQLLVEHSVDLGARCSMPLRV
jgi:hypothetical protein